MAQDLKNATKLFVKITSDTFVNGDLKPAGDVVELDPNDAYAVLAGGRGVLADEAKAFSAAAAAAKK